jgi:hypothetical protein
MLPLKEAIAEKHSLAEKMPFNQKMFRGELNNEEYANYLTQQYAIFNTLEKNPLPHPSLNRAELVKADIIELINEFGSQSIVLSIDIKKDSLNEFKIYNYLEDNYHEISLDSLIQKLNQCPYHH